MTAPNTLDLAGLLPCPFCGGKASVIYDSGNEVWNQSWRASCTKCSIHFERKGSSSWAAEKDEDDRAKASAIAAWNTRAQLQADADELARLRALLCDAVEDIESWSGYASDYFKEKHGLAESLAAYRAALSPPAPTP